MRPSLRTIAEAAGVSVATASFALRGLAHVRPETRARVLAAAGKLGYVRDPQLANALAFARRRNKRVYRESLAFLADTPAKNYPAMTWLARMHAGAAGRAAELGYGLECFKYPADAKAQRAQSRQLHARGIRGLLLTPGLSRVPFTLDMDWARFSSVEIGQTVRPALLPRIVSDYTDDYLAMMNELHLRGYRRIGLAVMEWEEARRQWSIIAGYLAFHHRNPDLPKLTVLPTIAQEPALPKKAFFAWLRREKPDVIIVNGPEMGAWLQEDGWKLPGDIGLCRIDALESADSGLHPDHAGMGRAGVNSLAAGMERGEIGPPPSPSLLCIPNAWHEGTTLRPRPDTAPPLALPLCR